MDIKKRGKGKKNVGYNGETLYRYYLKKVKPVKNVITGEKTRGVFKLDKVSDYNKILGELNTRIADLIIKDSFELKLPYNLGNVRIIKKTRKYKFDEQGELITKFLPINWLETKILWEKDQESRTNKTLVYHSNLHSGGCKFNFHWSKIKARTNNISVIAFKTTRTNARFLAKHILSGNKLNYFE